MRVLLGGATGAAAAAAAWMAIEHSTQQEFGWMAVAVGLVTGLAVRCAAGKGSRGSYGRGALAAVLVLLACVGCRQAYARFMMEKSDTHVAVAAATAPAEPDGAKPDEEATSEQATEPTKPVRSTEGRKVSGGVGFGDMSFKKGLSPWDMLWFSMAALTAYVVGKGRDQVAASDVAVESPDEPA